VNSDAGSDRGRLAGRIHGICSAPDSHGRVDPLSPRLLSVTTGCSSPATRTTNRRIPASLWLKRQLARLGPLRPGGRELRTPRAGGLAGRRIAASVLRLPVLTGPRSEPFARGRKEDRLSRAPPLEVGPWLLAWRRAGQEETPGEGVATLSPRRSRARLQARIQRLERLLQRAINAPRSIPIAGSKPVIRSRASGSRRSRSGRSRMRFG